MKDQLNLYNTTGKLPSHPYILCTTQGCDAKTTCFGVNLQSKIAKVGGVETLLTTFKCRECRAGKVAVKQKLPKKAKRITKQNARAAVIRDMINSTPKIDLTRRTNTALLRDLPEVVRNITLGGSCIRPDIYLDSGRKCDDCGYNTTCLASVKTFSKNYKVQTT